MADTQGGGQGTEAGNTFAPVFLSYASADKATADTLCAALESAGIPCWIAPRDVTPGVFYADAIVEAINASRILIVVLSANSAASQHVLREVERASSKRKPLIAFRLDTIPLPTGLEYFLSASHWLDASGGPIERAIPPLVDSVMRLLGTSSSSAPSPTDAVGNAGPTPKSIRKIWWTATAVGLMALLASGLWLINRTHRVTVPVATAFPAILDKSIAVLPFADMSEKKDQEYFSEGLSEELINLLSQVSELRVPARTSSFYFKDKSEDIPTIARRLMVAHVLEGSVRKSGNFLRITVQLVRADNGYHLWSETFDRNIDDIFKIQDEIAGAVVKALKISLLGAEAPQAIPTASSEAYTLYLQARSMYQHGNTHADDERAFDYLRKALQLDPRFVRAWASLAYFRCGDAAYFDLRLDPQGRAEAHDAAAHALALDPNSSDGHAAMGRFLFQVQWDWKGSESELRRALELDPVNGDALIDLSDLLSTLDGNSTEALILARRLIIRDPLYSINYMQVGLVNLRNGNFNEAEVAMRKAVDLAPAAELLPSLLASALLYQGEPARALAELEREPNEQFRGYLRPVILDRLGRTQEADRALVTYESKYADIAPYSIAAIYVGRKDLDRAFGWLERAYQQREFLLVGLRSDPDFINLRSDPRFKAFLRKMNLPE